MLGYVFTILASFEITTLLYIRVNRIYPTNIISMSEMNVTMLQYRALYYENFAYYTHKQCQHFLTKLFVVVVACTVKTIPTIPHIILTHKRHFNYKTTYILLTDDI